MATKSKTIDYLPVKDLHFDYANPRLAEYEIQKKTSEGEILKILCEAMDVRELVQSIAASGYFSHEPIIVASEGGRDLVIEGNRRLAAVKLLLKPNLVRDLGWTVPSLDTDAIAALQELPAIRSTRKDAWRYLGFKHVNGPAKWSSYAKAIYIGEVHRNFGVSLGDIANQIGDRHNTVQRLYRGLMVLEQAERAEVFDREDRFRSRLSFSHLYTGLDYDGFKQFLHLTPKEEEAKEPVPKTRVKQLGELLRWLYGSKREKQPPVIESQNPDLRVLNQVLGNRESIAALRANAPLQVAYQLSRPPTAVFEESLLAAKRELTTAKGNLTTGYDSSLALLEIAGSTLDLAESLYEEMEQMHKPPARTKKVRVTERS